MRIKKILKKDQRIAYIVRSKIGDENFNNFFWRKISPSRKIENAWQLVMDAYIIKNEEKKLKFQKIIFIRNKKGEILKKLYYENKC